MDASYACLAVCQGSMSDQALGPGPPPAMKVPCRGGGKEGPAKTATSPSSAGAAGGDGEWTDCEIRSVASSISDPYVRAMTS